MNIPSTLVAEHHDLHARLVATTRLPGATGAAAREVARKLHPHFVKEERYALPPLGALLPLAQGRLADLAEVLPLSRELEAELDTMLAEHREIVAVVGDMRVAAVREGHADAAALADALAAHVASEEQVMYPAAILVGRYLAEHPARQDEALLGA
jgi:hypothetical protein